jgi:hypothetical protein
MTRIMLRLRHVLPLPLGGGGWWFAWQQHGWQPVGPLFAAMRSIQAHYQLWFRPRHRCGLAAGGWIWQRAGPGGRRRRRAATWPMIGTIRSVLAWLASPCFRDRRWIHAVVCAHAPTPWRPRGRSLPLGPAGRRGGALASSASRCSGPCRARETLLANLGLAYLVLLPFALLHILLSAVVAVL